jgi:hypothetical protein
MKLKLQRFRPDSAGIRELLSTKELETHLGERGLRIADSVEAAGIRVEGRPGKIDLPVTVTVTGAPGRARARVILDHPAGQAVEAKHGVLSVALDAGRDLR